MQDYAKFLKLEQLDHDPSFQNETGRASMDGTGQVGTYFYTAPEIEEGWPQTCQYWVKVLSLACWEDME
ncbi:eukaryotic translation initiation factor 2-alpha kinase [Asimina triloba]